MIANQCQSLEKASILIFLNLHNKKSGMQANITLTSANVKGSYEYVAILILKKEEPQIKPSNTRSNRSIDRASLILSGNYVMIKTHI